MENKESLEILHLAKGRCYDGSLRNELTARRLKRLTSTTWISLNTCNKYEMVISEVVDQKLITRVNLIEKNRAIAIVDPKEVVASQAPTKTIPEGEKVQIHHKTRAALAKQQLVSERFLQLIDAWNREILNGSPLGQRLVQETGLKHISRQDFLILPNPLAPDTPLFGKLASGVAASIHGWLHMPDDQYIVPTDGTDEGALESLKDGLVFHNWEAETFDRPTHAAKIVITILNAETTSYVNAMASAKQKTDCRFTRNEYRRNEATREICIPDTNGDLSPIDATLYDCLRAML